MMMMMTMMMQAMMTMMMQAMMSMMIKNTTERAEVAAAAATTTTTTQTVAEEAGEADMEGVIVVGGEGKLALERIGLLVYGVAPRVRHLHNVNKKRHQPHNYTEIDR
jgi:hypothetical protein